MPIDLFAAPDPLAGLHVGTDVQPSGRRDGCLQLQPRDLGLCRARLLDLDPRALADRRLLFQAARIDGTWQRRGPQPPTKPAMSPLFCLQKARKPAINWIAGFRCCTWWLFTDSNRGPVDYDSIALTD
jgi:hypothetical protein